GSAQPTYSSIVGDVSLGDTDDCFGTDVRIDVQVTISNQGPDNAFGYPARFAIINKVTNEVITVDGLVVNFPAGSSYVASLSTVVPAADVAAGNIAILIALKTRQLATTKSWLLSDFSASYQFLPENTQACS